MLGLLFAFVSVLGATPQIWFCPLDPLFRTEVGYGGSPQYNSLFTPNAAWAQAASHVNVFKIYPQWIGAASDAELRAQFADLNRRGIALALEYGVITAPSDCGAGIEGRNGETLLNAALRIQRNGGTLRYVAMDEPTYFFTLYTGANACQWTVQRMAANAAVNIHALLAQFPDVQVGDIEPLVNTPNWLAQYQAGIEALQSALGFKLAFFDADVSWELSTSLADLAAARKMVHAEGLPFGIIYNGNPEDASDAQWLASATQHMVTTELNQGPPDLVIFQSWNQYPQKLLPETDADSFPALIDSYFRPRSTLASTINGSMVEGTLTSNSTGQPIAGAAIDGTLTPLDGSGVPFVYSFTGTVPAGTESIVMGARVNTECNCTGSADLLVSGFTFDAGSAGVITRDFSNQLSGWGLNATGSPAPTAAIAGAALHIAAGPGQTLQLNSSSMPFSAAVPYTFRVNAQVAPKTAGSGYFTVVFLGSTTEISRVQVPFAAAVLTIGGSTTDASGHYAIALPETGPEPFQIQLNYAGSGAVWPAQSQTSWSSQQTVSIAGVTSAASYAAAGVAPGEIVLLFGTGLGPQPLTLGSYGDGGYSTAIGQTTVAFDGLDAQLLYASSTQIAAMVPEGINAAQTAITVTSGTGRSLAYNVPVEPSVPGLFTADSSGSGQLAALNGDGTINAGNNPARVGDAVVLFGTGAGLRPFLPATVTVGGQPAQIDYYGSAPGEISGVFQLNLRVPVNAGSGTAVPVVLKIGGASTSKATTLAIR